MEINTTLVTDAYSASNIGDLELVKRTIEYASERTNESVVCLAVDPESFAPYVSVKVDDRLFPRLQFVSAGRFGKLVLALKWALALAMLTVVAFMPVPYRRPAALGLARLHLVSHSVAHYASSSRVIAVGGGYLGDQYVKETFLTTWTWWWATRLGCNVETMPVSFEVEKRLLSRFVRVFTARVTWRLRDSSSVRALRKAGLNAPLVPDLAFTNYSDTVSRNRLGTTVALVGSDYLDPVEQKQFLYAFASAMAASALPRPFSVLVMHSTMAKTHVGGDARAAEALVREMERYGETVREVVASTYSEVCGSMAGAEVVVSARMHAGIAGLVSGAKLAMIAYEEKHRALMHDLGLDNFVVDIRAERKEFVELFSRVVDANVDRFRVAAQDYALQLENGLYGGRRAS